MKAKRLQRWWEASCKGLLWGLIPLLALSGNLQAQECVAMSTTSGNTFPMLIRNEQTIANGVERIALAPEPLEALAITGELTFTERDGYFKAVLHDSNGRQHLVYRNISALNPLNEKIELWSACYETAFLDGITPAKLEIVAQGCSFHLKDLLLQKRTSILSREPSAQTLQLRAQTLKQARAETIQRINEHNRKRGILWAAGETSLSEAPYEVWCAAFGPEADEVETYGWQYYKGGILTYMDIDYDSLVFYDTTTAPYVERFDWSNRHGINWNSKVRDQRYYPPNSEEVDTQTCWAQGPLSALEAYINLYTGKKLDVELSLLELVSCSRLGEEGGSGSGCNTANSYLIPNGLMSEADFPFEHENYMGQDNTEVCNKKPSIPRTWYRPDTIKRIGWYEEEIAHDTIMMALLKCGPASAVVYEKLHVMSLVGWGVIKPGLFLEYWPDRWQPISIGEEHPMANTVYWVFKNSCGEGWGYNGYACMARAKSKYPRIPEPRKYPRGKMSFGPIDFFIGNLGHKVDGKVIPIPKVAFDDDKDGYYRWGLGGRPKGLDAPLLQDADDTDPNIGPMDSLGHANRTKLYDLYMRDRWEDEGVEPFATDKPIWESPDIWIRKENDNGTEHQTPIYDGSKPFYVKIKVRNRGEAPSSRHARLYLRWSQAGITLSRDSFLGRHKMVTASGDSIATGGFVTGVPLPIIPPKDSAVVTIEITKGSIPPPSVFVGQGKNAWHYCLLAEIMALDDPYEKHSDPSSLGNYVPRNNNVVQKNVTILEYSANTDPRDQKLGATVYLSNDHKDNVAHYELICYQEPMGGTASLTHEAELFLIPDNKLLQAIQRGGNQLEGMEQMPTLRSTVLINGISHSFQESPIRVKQESARIPKITLKPGEMALLSLRANFLTDEMTKTQDYKCIVAAKDKATGKIIGGETFIIKKKPRYTVLADLESITLEESGGKLFKAKPLNEEASYTWRNEAGRAVAEGLTVSTDSLAGVADLTLEVTAASDGFKDYSTVDVQQADEIAQLAISPNPVKEYLEVSYDYAEGASYSLVVTGISGNSHSYPVTSKEKPTRLTLTDLTAGSYTITLTADGKTVATGKFTKE